MNIQNDDDNEKKITKDKTDDPVYEPLNPNGPEHTEEGETKAGDTINAEDGREHDRQEIVSARDGLGTDKKPDSGSGTKPAGKMFFKYSVIVGSLLAVFFLCFTVVFLVLGVGRGEASQAGGPAPNVTSGPKELPGPNEAYIPSGTQGSHAGLIDDMFSAPRKTNFLILGLDQGGFLTDVMIAGSFDSLTGKLDLISVPRDTKITIDQADVKAIEALGRYVPTHGTMKLNELHSYAGKEHGQEFTEKYIGRMLGVEFNYYVKIDTAAFRYIVDEVGGIDVDVPKGGLHYSDPEQGLYINIPGGRQTLNGKQAEHFVRFRDTYRMGDLDRIKVQQQFMKEFFTQVLAKDEIMNNLQVYVSTFINYVKTDFPIANVTKYLGAISKLNDDSISFAMMPGYAENTATSSYYYQYKEQTDELIRQTFRNFDIGLSPELKRLRVTVLNGGNTAEFCETTVARLKAAGYANVSFGGGYSGSQTGETRIMLRVKEHGDILKNYFYRPRVEVDETLDADKDVIIIVGKNED